MRSVARITSATRPGAGRRRAGSLEATSARPPAHSATLATVAATAQMAATWGSERLWAVVPDRARAGRGCSAHLSSPTVRWTVFVSEVRRHNPAECQATRQGWRLVRVAPASVGSVVLGGSPIVRCIGGGVAQAIPGHLGRGLDTMDGSIAYDHRSEHTETDSGHVSASHAHPHRPRRRQGHRVLRRGVRSDRADAVPRPRRLRRTRRDRDRRLGHHHRGRVAATGTQAPPSGGLEGTPATLFVYVEDADATIERAVKLGAELKRPAQDQFYGDRDGHIIDPFGHSWTIATHVEDVTAEEMTKRMAELLSGG